jgi:hypothetical protein
MYWLGRYARVADHSAVKDVAQGALLGGETTLHPNSSTLDVGIIANVCGLLNSPS